MKITFINQSYYPDMAATGRYLQSLAEFASSAGHEVTVITSRRGYLDSTVEFAADEHLNGVHVMRVGALKKEHAGKISRIMDALFLKINIITRLIFLKRQDLLVTLTSPPLIGWPVSFYAACTGIPLVCWMMDLNPDQAVAVGWIKKGSLTERFSSKCLLKMLQRSRAVVALDEDMKQRLILKGVDGKKISVRPPWILGHETRLTGSEHLKSRKRIGLSEDDFLVMYAGNHSICHPLDAILDSALKLRGNPRVKFVFIGGGVRTGEVEEFKNRHKLTNVIQLPYQPNEVIDAILVSADLHAVVMGDSLKGIVHPCKIYSIIGANCPFVFIGPKESSITHSIQSNRLGYCVNSNDTAALSDLIQKLMQNNENSLKEILDAQREYKNRYSTEKMLKDMLDCILNER